MYLPTKNIFTSLIVFFVCAEAITHLHKGSQIEGEEFVLRGLTHGSKSSSARPCDTDFQKQSDHTVHFAVDLKMDALSWEELEDDEIQMSSCQRHGETHDVTIELNGKALDREDYSAGSAFVIDKSRWEQLCGPVPSLDGIDDQDPVLFFRMTNVQFFDSSAKIVLHLKAISGSLVAPSVRFDILERPLKKHTLKRYVVHDNPLYNSTLRMVGAPIGSFPDAESYSDSGVFSEFALFPGANISVSGVVEGAINNIRITRLFKLEVGWEQELKTDISSRLIASRTYYASNEKEVHRKPIEGALSTGRLLFFGTYKFNASTVVDIIQEISADSGVDAYLRATHQNLEAVRASFSTNDLDADSLLPPDIGSFGTFNINFDKVQEQRVGINGFYGARPGIIAEVQLGGISLVGTFTATLGLEASLQVKYPPFLPAPHISGASLGSCQECHRLEGRASVRGKDLQYHVYENNVLEKHKILDHNLFEKGLSTVCAYVDACPV